MTGPAHAIDKGKAAGGMSSAARRAIIFSPAANTRIDLPSKSVTSAPLRAAQFHPFDPGPAMAFRLFVPILAGATLRERLLACIGATIGIALTGMISGLEGTAKSSTAEAPIGATSIATSGP
ncbi:MAG: hypothetical protein E5W03_09765, partial [Mesorhizobium sp.]